MMKLNHLHYGWVMAIIACGILATHGILIYSFGVFLKPLTAEFDWDRGALSGALSVSLLLTGLLAIFTGRLSDKYGPRILVTLYGLLAGIGFLLMSQINSLWQVYLILGLLVGIGGSCCFTPVVSTVPRWFAQKAGIAVGVAVTGFGLGGAIWPPFTQWLIDTYDWRQAFVVLGLITLIVVIPLAQFMKHSPQRTGLKPYGSNRAIENKQSLSPAIEGLSFTQAIKTGRFWVVGVILFGFYFGCSTITAHIVPYVSDIGVSKVVAASILSIVAGTSISGRLSMGLISDKVGGRLALSACLAIAASALVWLLFSKEVWMFYVFAVVFGFAYGGIVPLQAVIGVELFGLSSLGMILGGFFLCATVGAALGPIIAGSIFDVTGSYSLALLIIVILGALTVIFSLVLLRYKAKNGVTVSN